MYDYYVPFSKNDNLNKLFIYNPYKIIKLNQDYESSIIHYDYIIIQVCLGILYLINLLRFSNLLHGLYNWISNYRYLVVLLNDKHHMFLELCIIHHHYVYYYLYFLSFSYYYFCYYFYYCFYFCFYFCNYCYCY